MGGALARAYTGGLHGGIAPSGVQLGKAPGQGSGGFAPEADDISAFLDYICEVNLTPEFLITGAY